jgi:hypothetical protein
MLNVALVFFYNVEHNEETIRMILFDMRYPMPLLTSEHKIIYQLCLVPYPPISSMDELIIRHCIIIITL